MLSVHGGTTSISLVCKLPPSRTVSAIARCVQGAMDASVTIGEPAGHVDQPASNEAAAPPATPETGAADGSVARPSMVRFSSDVAGGDESAPHSAKPEAECKPTGSFLQRRRCKRKLKRLRKKKNPRKHKRRLHVSLSHHRFTRADAAALMQSAHKKLHVLKQDFEVRGVVVDCARKPQ